LIDRKVLEGLTMLQFQPLKVATTSSDSHGLLVSKDGFLIAILVQLEPENHGEQLSGKWNLEATFDHLPFPPDEIFDDLDHAETWLNDRLLEGKWEEAREARAWKFAQMPPPILPKGTPEELA
jgi:hypothetical protein